jgi:hypothetical protein
MATGIVIWSKIPVPQKDIALNLIKSAYESRLGITMESYKDYELDGKHGYYPSYFLLFADGNLEKYMIFHIHCLEGQESGDEKWLDINFVNSKGENITMFDLYRLAVSESLDQEMCFHLIYHYLRSNNNHLISIYDYLIDWELMQSIYADGFSLNWFIRA